MCVLRIRSVPLWGQTDTLSCFTHKKGLTVFSQSWPSAKERVDSEEIRGPLSIKILLLSLGLIKGDQEVGTEKLYQLDLCIRQCPTPSSATLCIWSGHWNELRWVCSHHGTLRNWVELAQGQMNFLLEVVMPWKWGMGRVCALLSGHGEWTMWLWQVYKLKNS